MMETPAMPYHATGIRVESLSKTFVMHLRGGLQIPAVNDVSFRATAGECAVLSGPSGAGKSSILKMIYGSYRADSGSIFLETGSARYDIAQASPRRILAMRKHTIGYVSQFLRVIPRVSTLDIVRTACSRVSGDKVAAQSRAQELLTRLHIPEQLWSLPPQTFSGGEQQRINIARGFGAERSVLLLDEPTASLDADNRSVVIEMIREKKQAGVTIVGIFHDEHVREAVADIVVPMARTAGANSEKQDAVSV